MRQVAEVILGTALGANNLFHAQLLVVIEQELAQRGYDCVIRTCNGQYDQFLSLCETLRTAGTRQALSIGYFPVEQIQTILGIVPHVVLVDYTADPRLNQPYESVGFDNVAAARLAVRHLIEHGRSRILLIKGQADHYFSRDIEDGYRQICHENKLSIDEAFMVTTDFTAENAYRVIQSLITAGMAFDAVFTNDEMAIGALSALHDAGKTVPDEVAVVGCDGLPLGNYTIPRLTTVILDYYALGRLAVERLFALRKKPGPPCRIQLAPRLEIRDSSLRK